MAYTVYCLVLHTTVHDGKIDLRQKKCDSGRAQLMQVEDAMRYDTMI